jgi:hypothetical protein
MKKLLFALLFLAASPPILFGQNSGTITSTQKVCVDALGDKSTVGIQVTGTWTGTLQPQVSLQGQAAANSQVVPSTSTTPQSTITGNGVFYANVGGAGQFCIVGNTVASGTATIFLNASKGVNASTLSFGGGSIASGTTGQPAVYKGPNSIGGGTKIFYTVSTDGTGNYNASGTADQVPINAAITAANAAGGGTVFIQPGTYNLTACIQPQNNVIVMGLMPNLLGAGGSDNTWTQTTGGTWLVGDGLEDGFCYNTAPSNVPASYTSDNALKQAAFYNLGLQNFINGFHIGSQNNPGAYWGIFKNIWVYGCSQWGLDMENFSESYFEQIHAVSNANGDQYYAATVNGTKYNPGNAEFHQLYSDPLNNLARGIVFAAPPAESNNGTVLNSIKVFNAQVNRFRDTLTTQTITPANGSTSVSVTDLTKFKVGMPFWVTSTADGYTQNVMYFVLSVSGASGAGTITAGTSAGAVAAISASASTALTMNSYGFANIEIAGTLSTSPVSTVNAELFGLDLEGNSSMDIYAERGNLNTYQVAFISQSGGPSGFVLRTDSYPQIMMNYPVSADIDGATQNVLWNGARSTLQQFQPKGLYFDSIVNSPAITIQSRNVNGTNNPDVYIRNSGSGNFWYPQAGIGEGLFTQDTSTTLGTNKCGTITFNGAAGQTFTLPTIDNAATKNASIQGCRFKIVNASANTLAIATSSSQTFNNVAAKTTTTMAINSTLELTAATTGSGGTLYWAAQYNATALP